MLTQFPRHGKIISLILLGAITFFIYHVWAVSPFNRIHDLKPGDKEYKLYHRQFVDTIPADSIKVWYKKLKDSGRYEP